MVRDLGRKIREDITPEGLAGRLLRSGVSIAKVLKAVIVMLVKQKK